MKKVFLVTTLFAVSALALQACGAALPDICDRDHPLYDRAQCSDRGDGANADTPKVEKPKVSKPKVSKPKVKKPKVTKPKVKTPVGDGGGDNPTGDNPGDGDGNGGSSCTGDRRCL